MPGCGRKGCTGTCARCEQGYATPDEEQLQREQRQRAAEERFRKTEERLRRHFQAVPWTEEQEREADEMMARITRRTDR